MVVRAALTGLALLAASAAAALASCHGGFTRDPCHNVDCSGHGTCLDNGEVASCLCEAGFEPEGLACVAIGPDGDGDVDGDGDADADADADGDEVVCGPEVCNYRDDDCDGMIDEGFNLTTSTAHCGRCDNACPSEPINASSRCLAAECVIVCDSGFDDCTGGPSDGCETSLASPLTCGGCDVVCPESEPVCLGSEFTGYGCAVECPDTYEDCDGACVDVFSDPGHCGDCLSTCASPVHSSATCTGGMCDFDCDEGWGDCVESADGCETDLATTADCGGCGNACDPIESCMSGSCAIDCPEGCDCERACESGPSCECRNGCPCHLTCVGDCEVRCLDPGTVCVVDVAAGEDPDRIECQHGAECHVSVDDMGDLGPDARCRDAGTVCEYVCGSGSECSVECTYGAQCLLRCAPDAFCEFESCSVAVELCADDSIVCNRPCP